MPPHNPGLHGADELLVLEKPLPVSPDRVAPPAQTGSAHPLKILILEDEPTDAELTQRALRKAGLDFTAQRVDNRVGFIEALETFAPDIVLSDYKLPDFNGADALAHVRHVHPEVPVVIVSGVLGDEGAVDLLHAGAADYVLKGNLARLSAAIERAVSVEHGTRARKAAERALRLSEERYRTLVTATTHMVWTTDAQGKIVVDHPDWRALTGLTIEEIKGDGWAAALHPDDLEQTMEAWSQAVNAGAVYATEFRVRRVDGEYRNMAVRGVPVLNQDGTVREWIGTYTDITERMRAEDRIREDEAKFRSLVEQNVAGIFIIREDGTIGYVNPFFASVLGYAASELIGRPLLDFIPEDKKQEVREKLGAQLSGGELFLHQTSSMLTRNGQILEVLVNASRSIFEGGPASLAVVLDVTERNKAQRELAETAAILATEHELSPDGILVVDDVSNIVSVNRRFAEIFSVPAQLLSDKADEPVLAWVGAQMADSAAFLSRVRYLYDHGEETSHDEITLKNGRVLDRYGAAMKRPSGGGYRGWVWFFRDITDRKRAEEDLRSSEERFRLLVENAPDAILLYDADPDRFVAANRTAEQLFACPRDEILKYGPQHFFPPEQPDARPVAQSFAEHNAKALSGEKLTYERRILNDLGQERLCQVTLVQMPSPGRRLLRASFIDITERKAAERTLQRLNRTLRTLSRGNEALVRAASESELLHEMCHVIVETGGYRMAWIGVPQQDAAKSVTPVAWSGETGLYLEKARITWADEPRGNGPHGRAIRSGEPQVTQDLSGDPSMAPWVEEVTKCGFASSVVLPLKDGSGVFAALMIYSTDTQAFNTDELNLLQELANDLAFGIRSLREHTAREALDTRWRASLEATVGAIASTVEMRDPYTSGHQQRVARVAVAIAHQMALPDHQIQGLYLAGIVHDVGKINIPAEILNKPGKLSKLEYQLIQGHAEAGYDIIKGVDFPWPIAQMVRQHHERLDGSGYPQGLKGEAILPEAKILAVADVVESMMSHRPYRAALGIDAALAEIEKGRGSTFDPDAVDACIALFRQQGFSIE